MADMLTLCPVHALVKNSAVVCVRNPEHTTETVSNAHNTNREYVSLWYQLWKFKLTLWFALSFALVVSACGCLLVVEENHAIYGWNLCPRDVRLLSLTDGLHCWFNMLSRLNGCWKGHFPAVPDIPQKNVGEATGSDVQWLWHQKSVWRVNAFTN